MKLFKNIIILLMLSTIISACSGNKNTVQTFEDGIQKIEKNLIGAADWGKADIEVNKLKKQFNKDLWKMQMLGDENEYENLKTDLIQLEAAIKAEDKTQVSIFLSSIDSYITSIFKTNKIEQEKPNTK